MEPGKYTKYLPFKNKSNNCWLNSSIVIIAHNKTLKKIADVNQDSQIYEIISTYEDAVSILNGPGSFVESVKACQMKLLKLQISTHLYLQPKLKSKFGEPDSAFCALLNLLYQDKFIKNSVNISWLWEKNCVNCGKSSKSKLIVKPIITLSKVNRFEPVSPTSRYKCSCETEQEMKLIYRDLPPCLFFHFENGAGNRNAPPLNFTIQSRTYHLCGMITLERSENTDLKHFVSYIRDPFCSTWLDCNDLNTDIIVFSREKPEFNPEIVYMYVFESFDSLDKISNQISEDIQGQNLEISDEVIDISDETDDMRDSLESDDEDDLAKTKKHVVASSSKTYVGKPFHESPKSCKMMTKTVKHQDITKDNFNSRYASRKWEFSEPDNEKNKLMEDLEAMDVEECKDIDEKCSSQSPFSEKPTSECTTITQKNCRLNSPPNVFSSEYSVSDSDKFTPAYLSLSRSRSSNSQSTSFHSISENDTSESTAVVPTGRSPISSYQNEKQCNISKSDEDVFVDDGSESYLSSESVNCGDGSGSSVSSGQLSCSIDVSSPGIPSESSRSDCSIVSESDSQLSDRSEELLPGLDNYARRRNRRADIASIIHRNVTATLGAFMEQVLIKSGKL